MADQSESAGVRRLPRYGEPKKFIAEIVDADRFARLVLGFAIWQIVKRWGFLGTSV